MSTIPIDDEPHGGSGRKSAVRTPSNSATPRLSTKKLGVAVASSVALGMAVAVPSAGAASWLYCHYYENPDQGCTVGPHQSWSWNEARNQQGQAACVNEYNSWNHSWVPRRCHNAGVTASFFLCCSVVSGYVQGWNGSTDTYTSLHARVHW